MTPKVPSLEAPANWRELELLNGRSPRLASVAPVVSEFRVTVESQEPGFDWRALRTSTERETIDNAGLIDQEIAAYVSAGILTLSEPKGRKYTY